MIAVVHQSAADHLDAQLHSGFIRTGLSHLDFVFGAHRHSDLQVELLGEITQGSGC